MKAATASQRGRGVADAPVEVIPAIDGIDLRGPQLPRSSTSVGTAGSSASAFATSVVSTVRYRSPRRSRCARAPGHHSVSDDMVGPVAR